VLGSLDGAPSIWAVHSAIHFYYSQEAVRCVKTSLSLSFELLSLLQLTFAAAVAAASDVADAGAVLVVALRVPSPRGE
jgi:hypothetical protein